MGHTQETILVIEDDPNDIFLLQRALKKNNIVNPVQILPDGLEALAYLGGNGKYADRTTYPFPRFIIMDLKMPRMTGLEVLEWLKKNPQFQVIPTLVLTSSRLEQDISRAYQLGANSYMVKPSNFSDLQEMIRRTYDYWMVCMKPRLSAEGTPEDDLPGPAK